MSLSSLCYAINGALFKFVTEEQQNFLPALFWDFLGKVILGILIFLFIRGYRESFLAVVRKNGPTGLALNSLNEILGIIGEAAFVFAMLLAPVALVQVVSGFQPVFIFIYGVLLTLFFPKIANESLGKKDLAQKIIGIAIIVVGTLLIV
jgi:drug/metabolite transporter (DMT)-like permease